LPLGRAELRRLEGEIAAGATECAAARLHHAVRLLSAAELQQLARIIAVRRRIAGQHLRPPLERRAERIIAMQHHERTKLHGTVHRLARAARR
jgi:hypothetical protein